ncbi:MAG: hypothetical protein SFW66_01240 [Gammaproteobacteria bacterium]|nr:hypothetical protein [Gammaproteobacteria bacterium]
MKKDDDLDKKKSSDEKGGESGQSGTGGKVRFRLPTEDVRREDQLSPAELRRLARVHQDAHKARVDRQRQLRAERCEKKEGPANLATARRLGQSGGAGRKSPYKKHPISNTAQFSGMDPQMTLSPHESVQETNDDKRNELENRLENKLQNKLQLQNQPKFNPKPRPF